VPAVGLTARGAELDHTGGLGLDVRNGKVEVHRFLTALGSGTLLKIRFGRLPFSEDSIAMSSLCCWIR
jgi:hypothetical protein